MSLCLSADLFSLCFVTWFSCRIGCKSFNFGSDLLLLVRVLLICVWIMRFWILDGCCFFRLRFFEVVCWFTCSWCIACLPANLGCSFHIVVLIDSELFDKLVSFNFACCVVLNFHQNIVLCWGWKKTEFWQYSVMSEFWPLWQPNQYNTF
jgi:hypothetical protein